MSLIDMTKELCSAVGTSGDEGAAADKAAALLSRFMPVRRDALGNVIGESAKRSGKKRILLDAHIDQIGMAVTAIDEKGFLKVAKCGGADALVLAASEVTVWGKKPLFGVVTSTPPHLAKDEKEKTAADFSELAIDIGLSKQEAEKLVSLGDRVTQNGAFEKLLGNRVVSSALDDRISVAAILRCLEMLEGKSTELDVSVLFAVQEETGGSGARTGSFSVQPDMAVAVDVSFADAPGVEKDKCGTLGGGTMIGFSPSLSHSMSLRLRELAVKNSIDFQNEIMGASTGTDADSISNTAAGIETGLVSIPIRNMHTASEVADMSDAEATAQLLCAYITDGEGE